MPVTPVTDLLLIEVFSSLQGEGVFIGRRQLFVRLAGCNLACAYCDTDFSAAPTWHAETAPGGTGLQEYANPASPVFLIELIRNWQTPYPVHHSLALTGGEPLLQSRELTAWLPSVSEILPVFLETNGTLAKELGALLPFLSWISMDIKLTSTTGTPTPWEAHAAFLRSAGGKVCQVKMVVDAMTTEAEVTEAAGFVARHGAGIPLILQPKTAGGRPEVMGGRLLSLQSAAAREHRNVLVIPQVHPFLALR